MNKKLLLSLVLSVVLVPGLLYSGRGGGSTAKGTSAANASTLRKPMSSVNRSARQKRLEKQTPPPGASRRVFVSQATNSEEALIEHLTNAKTLMSEMTMIPEQAKMLAKEINLRAQEGAMALPAGVSTKPMMPAPGEAQMSIMPVNVNNNMVENDMAEPMSDENEPEKVY